MTDLDAKAREIQDWGAINKASNIVHRLNMAGYEFLGAAHRLGSREMDIIATALREARAAALEEAANIARDIDWPDAGIQNDTAEFIEGWESACAHIAARIRALKGE